MDYTVEPDWLQQNLAAKNIRVIDCRFNLANPDDGQNQYKSGHIPGSLYFDLEKDLSGPVQEHGGRHPLPNVELFTGKLAMAGIGNDTTVIAYDNGEGAFAGRLWWLLNYIGHENVYILNGGMKAWLDISGPVTTEIPSYELSEFVFNVNADMVATYEEVYTLVHSKNTSTVLIDSREHKRYTGEVEPIDKKSGHIPGAINKVWIDGLENGRFKQPEQQKARFYELDPRKQYIVYCGSGITAIPNYLAMKSAGFKNVLLYPGSFSDWISYDDNKVDSIK